MTKQDYQTGVIDQPNDPRFKAVYACYEKCFTLPEERETEKNFNKIMMRNGNPKIEKIAGKSKEMWVYLQNPENGEVMAAANFDVFAGNKAQGVDGTVHDIYLFVDPQYRQNGIFKELLKAREEAAKEFCREVSPETKNPRILAFAEQNAPLLMTGEEYLHDTNAALIDQCVRREVFEGKDYETLNFRYVQPPLTRGGDTCDYLDMVVQNAKGEAVPSACIKEHLERFFALSFPRGTKIPDQTANDLDNHELISTAPLGKHAKLGKILHTHGLEKLTDEDLERPLGKVFPRLTKLHYGKDFKELERNGTAAKPEKDEQIPAEVGAHVTRARERDAGWSVLR
jgi:GNAT superfamily N-acetyltransferase